MNFESGLNVAVLMGGVSQERQISLQSGDCVCRALRDAGLEPVESDVGPDDLSILDRGDIDVFFIALHGTFGEDGQLQQILEERSLVFTGSGSQASRLAFNKIEAKKRFAEVGVETPKAIVLDPQEDVQNLTRQIEGLGERFVVKPLRQGSTIGISIEDDAETALAAGYRCFEKFGDCMIEQYIRGKELTVGILGGKALPVLEIRARDGFYDYDAKYLDDDTEFLFDTIESSLAAKIQQEALLCFEALGLRHFARIDFMLSDDSEAFVLEANTIPGMTSHSLVPKAAERMGLSMSELCVRIVEEALDSSDRTSVVFGSGFKE